MKDLNPGLLSQFFRAYIKSKLLLVVVISIICTCEINAETDHDISSNEIDKSSESVITAKEILEQTIHVYTTLKSYKDNTEISASLITEGIENTASYKTEIIIEKPNRFSVKSHSDVYGRTAVSDGNKLWIYLPFLNKYTEDKSPPDLKSMLTADLNNITTLGSERYILFLFFKKNNILADKNMDISIYGEEIFDGRPSYIIDLNNDNISMRLWIDMENRYISKIILDATSIIKKQQKEMGIEDSPEISMEYTEIHSDIIIDSGKISKNLFKFIPPDNSQLVDKLYEGEYEKQDYPYLEKKLIEFELKSINNKGTKKLTDYYGNVIILSFSDISKNNSLIMLKDLKNILTKYRNKPFEIVAVDTIENEKDLKKIIKNNKLDYPILIDEKKSTSLLYGITSPPAIFIINENGIIKQVYTDYFVGMKESLEKDINNLLINMGSITLEEDNSNTKGLHKLWNIPVKTAGFISESDILAVSIPDDIYCISAQGSIDNIIELKKRLNQIKKIYIANDKFAYIGYRKRGHRIYSFNDKGRINWNIIIEQGINDIISGNLNNDKLSEIIVSRSGLGGITIFDNTGTEINTSTSVLNTIKLDIGNISGNSTPEIIAAKNEKNIFVLDNNGVLINKINSDIFVNYLKVAGYNSILICGSSHDSEIIKNIDNKGNLIWELILGNTESSRVHDVKIHPNKNLIAVSTVDGQVFVFNSMGDVVGYTREKGINISIGWLTTSTGQTNLVTSSIESGLNAYLPIENKDEN